MGAEKLLGRGDMLYMPVGTGTPTRIHGAFVADNEVHRVVENLKSRGEPQYEEDVLNGPENGEGSELSAMDGESAESEREVRSHG